jgi:hypothetical protein
MSWWKRWLQGDRPEDDFAALVAETQGGSSYAYEALVHHLTDVGLKPERGAEEELGWLRAAGPSTWRGIDGAARDSRLYADPFPPLAKLLRELTAGCSTLLAVMASFHRSGHAREAAVAILSARDDAVADKALALRTADWVDVVRQKARIAVLERVDRRQALSIVPVLVALQDQERSKGLIADYLSRLGIETVRDLARFGSRATRRLLIARPDLPDEDLLQRAVEDEDPLVRTLSARALLSRDPGAAAELFIRGSGLVRAIAVAQAPAALVLEKEEQLLLDRRATVRRAGQRRLSELGADVADRYRALVEAEPPVPVAIVGLGECGTRADEPRITALVRHDDEAVRRAALNACRFLVSETALIELAAVALHDTSDLVVRAAARVLRRRAARIPKQVVDAAVASDSRATHLAGLRLARRADGWSRLEADLMLSIDDDETVAREGREDLLSWVNRVAPTLYGAPPPSQRESISRLLERAHLDASLDREIRFHSGVSS